MRPSRLGRAAAAALLAGCVSPAAREPVNLHFLREAEKHFLLEEYGRAAGHYEAFLNDNPEHPDRAEIRARAGRCHLGAGRPDLALAAFEKALAENPSGPLRWEILFRRAVAWRLAGDPGRAVESFRAMAAAPAAELGQRVTRDEFHYEYALALFRAGDWRAGHAELARVAPLGPYGERARSRQGLTAFAVQVGAYADEARARAEASKVKGSVRPVPGDRPLFVVLTGSFPRYEDAQREADRLRPLYPDAFVVP